MTAMRGNLAADVLAFMQSYARPWDERDPAGIAAHYHQPLTLARPASVSTFGTRDEVLGFSKQVLSMWFPEGGGDDTAAQPTPHGGHFALVHVRWGRWVVRLPGGHTVRAPECDYVLARPGGSWKIVMVSVGW